jgi:hypothetical protein
MSVNIKDVCPKTFFCEPYCFSILPLGPIWLGKKSDKIRMCIFTYKFIIRVFLTSIFRKKGELRMRKREKFMILVSGTFAQSTACVSRCCTEYDWRLQPLFMTLKHLFKLNNIVGGGGGERLTRHVLKNKINTNMFLRIHISARVRRRYLELLRSIDNFYGAEKRLDEKKTEI